MLRIRVLAESKPLSFCLNQSSAMVLYLLLVFPLVEADTLGPNYPSLQDTTYQPNLAVVIGILGVMFVLTILILVYAKLCHRAGQSATANRGQNRAGLLSSSRRFSGLDKAVIESLPFFRFSSLKGSKEGLECAVCLSRFEGVEVLRLLPKCRHAFHIDCIDHWLERHSSCPLCRDKVSSQDLKLITYSNSLRFLRNNNDDDDDDGNGDGDSSNIEIFVQREESQRGSSRFNSIIGNSFRRIRKEGDKEELLIRNKPESDQRVFHKHKHKMVVSGFVFNNRWSNVSSSDLIFLSSEMLNDVSSGRFASIDLRDVKTTAKLASENEESFENKVGAINSSPSSNPIRSFMSTSRSVMNSGEQRSVSEITAFSRCGNSGVKNKIVESCSVNENDIKEERVRKVWLPIARRTVQWFANRERSQLAQNPQRQSIDV